MLHGTLLRLFLLVRNDGSNLAGLEAMMAMKKAVRRKKTKHTPKKAERIVQKAPAQKLSGDPCDVHLTDYLMEAHPELGIPGEGAMVPCAPDSRVGRRQP